MKTAACTLAALLSLAAVAAQKMSPEERESLIQQKVGGFIELEAKGSLVVINCQKYFDIDDIANLAGEKEPPGHGQGRGRQVLRGNRAA